ncbi:MAG: GDP-mannose pyrophosphorylase [Planctomycetota bacterium]|nr:MAG: GDP-mannose pyrophosphorylase [Planctomycetota bacterium]
MGPAAQAALRQALVLCAGEGRRLRPLTQRVPKPLAPFLNLPMLRHSLRCLQRAGVQRVWLNAWHLADAIEAFAASDPEPGLELRVLREPELLGTGGAIANLAPQLHEGPLLVAAADILSDAKLGAFAQAHVESGADASMLLTTRADPEQFGPVEIDTDGRLTDIVRTLGRPGERALVNASYHLLERRVIERFPRGPCCLVRQGYLPWMRDGLNCRGVLHEGAWAETGNAAALLAAQRDALSGALPVDPSLLAEGGVRRGASALVHPQAQVAPDAQLLDGTTVAEGCVIGAGARLHGCLLLPGTHVEAGRELHDVLLGPHQTVECPE